MKYKRQYTWKVLACICVMMICVCLLAGGCTSITRRVYSPFIQNLDGKNELCISTFPAGSPKKISGVPLVYKKLATHDHVYFQVHVRDIARKAGKNPHVDSIKIHSFSYRIDKQPETELISGHDYNFWMQGNPKYDTPKSRAVPYDANATVFVDIEFTLNGQDYSFKGEMLPSEHTGREPFLNDLKR